MGASLQAIVEIAGDRSQESAVTKARKRVRPRFSPPRPLCPVFCKTALARWRRGRIYFRVVGGRRNWVRLFFWTVRSLVFRLSAWLAATLALSNDPESVVGHVTV